MLDRLESSGHIQRIFDPSDRRTIRIRLTKTARNLKGQYNKVSLRMNEIFYDGFNDKEILIFERGLARVLNNLTKKEGTK